MTKLSSNGLTVRKLSVKDADLFAKISNGPMMTKFLPFLKAKNVTQAEEIIRKNSRYNYAMYGLFVRRVGLVSVFAVSPNLFDGADVHYFTGEKYYGNGYATQGIEILAQLLSSKYDYFTFSIHADNVASLAVQRKLGSSELESKCKFYRDFCYSL
ncbi:MAG: GNAT family N-acetyltransferase [Clostridia bacterium]|nr:GNAT family N-acetyltransferase [Clostridia bacterium]